MVLCIILLSNPAQGQMLAGTDPEPEELLSLSLPTLDDCIQGAVRVSPARKYFEGKSAMEALELKRVRFDWLKLFSLEGSYRYGMTQAMISQNTSVDLVSTFNTQAQNWYSVGANITLPINFIFESRNKVKQQRLKVEMELAQAKMEDETLRDKVITLYCDVQLQMNLLRTKGELFKMGYTQMKMSESAFIRGDIKIVEYTRQMDIFTKMQVDYEMCRNALRTSLIKLEYLTDLKLLK